MESIRHSSLNTDPNGRTVVEVSAPVPIAVPGFALDGLLHGVCVLAPGRGGVSRTAPLGDRGEPQQRRV